MSNRSEPPQFQLNIRKLLRRAASVDPLAEHLSIEIITEDGIRQITATEAFEMCIELLGDGVAYIPMEKLGNYHSFRYNKGYDVPEPVRPPEPPLTAEEIRPGKERLQRVVRMIFGLLKRHSTRDYDKGRSDG